MSLILILRCYDKTENTSLLAVNSSSFSIKSEKTAEENQDHQFLQTKVPHLNPQEE